MTEKHINKRRVSFNDYKTIRDEIVEISELRFESILTKRLKSFKKEFKHELLDELGPRFESINTRFNAIDTRFNAVEKRLSCLTWFLPVLLTLLLTVFRIIR